MPTQNLIFRAGDELRDLAKARAEREHRNVSDIARSALSVYLTGDDGGEALDAALVRAEDAEAKAARLEKALAAARKKNRTLVAATAARAQHRAPEKVLAQQARADARDAKDEAFAAALQAATEENPVTVSRLAALTGFTATWCRDLLGALGEAGYAEKAVDAGPRTGPGRPRFDWVPVPGKDIGEGIKAAKALAERGPAKSGPRYREGGDLARPVATVKFREPKMSSKGEK